MMRKTVVITMCIIMAALLVCLGAAWYFLGEKKEEPAPSTAEALNILGGEFLTFCEGISVDGLDISGMTLQEAAGELNRLHVAADEAFTLELVYESYANIIQYPDITVRYNTAEILDEAIKLGNGMDIDSENERNEISHNGKSYFTQKTYSIDDISVILADVAQSLYIEPIDATARFDISLPEKFAYTPGIDGRAADIVELERELNVRMEQQRFGESVAIPVTTLEPLVSSEMLLRKNVMISTFSTSFASRALSGKDRVSNLERLCAQINGACVMPGETFDLANALGPLTAETGWKRANVILGGAYESQFGGGASQGASTLYNAVMMADLEVSEREPEGWSVGYVPLGRDAAFASGGPNFCFLNNRESPVYVVSYCNMEEKTITCEIWGEPLQNGMSIKLDSKKTASLKALGTKTQIDPSLGAGKKRVARQARTGATAQTFKEYYDSGGTLVKRELYTTSTYDSVEGLVYVSAVPKGSQASSAQLSTPAPFPVVVQ